MNVTPAGSRQPSTLSPEPPALKDEAASPRPATLSSGALSLVNTASRRGPGSTSPENLGVGVDTQINKNQISDLSEQSEPSHAPTEAGKGAFQSIGEAIASFFSSAGSAISNVVQAVFVTNTVATAFGGAGERVGDALRGLWTGGRDTAIGVYKNIEEAVRSMGYGVQRLCTGHADGFVELGRGVAKLLQTSVDAAILSGVRVVSALQTLSGVEPVGRELNATELQTLRDIFGDSVDLDAVRLKEGNAGLFSLENRPPWVHGNTVYMQNDKSLSTLVHEVTHVWQHQNGGTDYMSEALLAHWTKGLSAAYDWRAAAPTQAWAELNPEQQGALIESAFNARAFTKTPPEFPNGTRLPSGMTLTDLNRYLQHAVAELRAGRGAP